MLGTTIALLAVGYLGLVALAFFAQRSLLFPAPAQAAHPSPDSQLVELAETVLLVRAPPSPTAPVVLHFHGNGEQLAWTEWMGEAYQRQGIGFVSVEYPGYGLAKGKGAASEPAAPVRCACDRRSASVPPSAPPTPPGRGCRGIRSRLW